VNGDAKQYKLTSSYIMFHKLYKWNIKHEILALPGCYAAYMIRYIC